MALILVDGLEDASSWASSFTSFTTGRTGNCLQMTLSQTADFTIISALGTATITVGFAFNAGADLLGGNFLSLRSDAGVTNHVNIAVNSDGSLSALRATTSLGSSAASIIAVNTWYYVEVTATLSDTVGAVVVKVNGTTVINLTGQDTKNAGTKTVFDTVRLTRGSGGANNHRFDDLYIRNDSTTHGDCVVETLYPNGNGTSGYGADQRPTIAGPPNSLSSAGEGGARYSFARAGQVVGVRYTKVSGIGSVTYKLQAWNAAGTKVADVSDTQTLLGTGPYTVTFPTPVAIAAGETWTFSYSTPANNVPVGPSGSAVTNTADVTFIEYRYNFTADTYPNGVTTNACYVEPIFEAVNTWLGSDGDSTDNYLLVNETGVPNVSNNVTDSTSGRQDMYTLTDLVRSGTVIGVCHSTYAAKSDSGSIQFKLVNRRSADNKSGAISPTTAYVGYQYVLENDPETSAAWTVANVNALQSGVEVV